MQNSQENQALLTLPWILRTRMRAWCLGMGVGLIVAAAFLLLSLKFTDSSLDYNPYRWISRPHEWLMLFVLVAEAQVFTHVSKSVLGLSQVVVLFCFAHTIAGMLLYGTLSLMIREVWARVSKALARRKA